MLLQELRNCILRTILVWSLFYSIRVYTVLYFLLFFWKTSLFCFSAFFVFSACSDFDVMFMNFCNICITTIHIVDVRYSVFLFSLITFRVLLNRAPTSTQLHPPPPSSTQLHLPPPSSFQPPPSSTHLHSAQLSLHTGHYNTLNNI